MFYCSAIIRIPPFILLSLLPCIRRFLWTHNGGRCDGKFIVAKSSSAVRMPVVRFMAVHSLSVMQCGRAARNERVQKPGNGRMDFAASWVLFILSQRRRVRKEIFCGACGKMKFLRRRRQSEGLPRTGRGSPFFAGFRWPGAALRHAASSAALAASSLAASSAICASSFCSSSQVMRGSTVPPSSAER